MDLRPQPDIPIIAFFAIPHAIPALSVLLLLLPALACAQHVPTLPPIAAKAYVLADYNSGQLLVSHNPQQRVEPASLTKLMTAYVVFAALKQKTLKADQTVPVSARAWKSEGSRMFIEPNKPVTVDELLKGMIVQSGNDACVALAEAVAGSEEVFAQMMNREAQRLGMKNTNFVNSTGPAASAALHDRVRSGAARVRDHPRLPRVLSALLDQGIPLQQHHAVEPQPAAVGRPDRRRHEDRLHRERGLLPDHFGAPRSAAARFGRAGRELRIRARHRKPEAPQLRLPVLRHACSYTRRTSRCRRSRSGKAARTTVKAGFPYDLYLSVPKGYGDKLKATIETQQPLLAPIAAGQKIGVLQASCSTASRTANFLW